MSRPKKILDRYDLAAAMREGRYDEAVDFLTDLTCLEAIAKSSARDLNWALRDSLALLPLDYPRRAIVESLYSAIKRETGFLDLHYERLFQLFWNHCRWEGASGAPHGEALRLLLEQWREQVDSRSGFTWLEAKLASVPDDARLTFEWSSKEPNEEFYLTAFSAGGRFLASSTKAGAIYLWDLTSGGDPRIMDGGDFVGGLTFSRDGCFLGAIRWGKESRVFVWHLETGRVFEMPTGEGKFYSLAFSPDGRLLAAGGSRADIVFWDFAAGRERGRFQCPLNDIPGRRSNDPDWENQVTKLCFNSDGSLLAAALGYGTGRICLWELKAEQPEKFGIRGALLWNRWEHNHAVLCFAFSSDSHFLASSSRDETVHLWKTRGLDNWPVHMHSAAPSSILFTSDGSYLAIGTWPGNVLLRGITKDDIELGRFGGYVKALTFLPGGQLLVAAGDKSTVCVYEVEWEEEEDAFQTPFIAFSPDSQWLAKAGDTVSLWDVNAGAESIELPQLATELLFSPDGSYLVALDEREQTCDVWNWKGQTLLWSQAPVEKAAFNEAGALVARYRDGSVCVCNLQNGDFIARFEEDFDKLAYSRQRKQPWYICRSLGKTCLYPAKIFREKSSNKRTLPLACVPLRLEGAELSATDPRLMAGFVGRHLQIFRLHGAAYP